MSSQNTYLDLPSFARKYLADAISHHNLQEGHAGGGIFTLSSTHCIIYLENVESNFVGFDFASSQLPEVKYDLGFYLDSMVAGGSATHCPKPPREWNDEDKFVHYLKAFNSIILNGNLDMPLRGDFAWRNKYDAFVADYKHLASVLTNLSRGNLNGVMSMLQKRNAFDLTWMDDVRRILAEQESKS